MTTQDTMRLALDALEAHADIGIRSDKAIEALKSALAQQGEPVAWCALSLDGKHIAFFDGKPVIMVGPVGNDCHQTPLYAGAAPAAQHPTIEQVLNCYSPDDTATDYQDKLIDLFKAAPAAQPLTDEQLAKAWATTKGDLLMRIKPFARAIEAAHGIGVQK